ncbi:hypothetical protein H0H81_000156 [Sphagnurus paluster]|uniref:Thioredoxin domain-containing protein n=1 Tax=Sphagnurus paluster TaxID=117069 RepID=A0A9P7K347_9AGAR|nr:hypothetical protein H0H81_000156 [Sphagnurus paluster]
MLASTVHFFALLTILAPSLVSAAIFPKDTKVQMLDPKGFKQAMKQNHCKNLAPEYHKVAKSFHPLLPVYAVDCDANENKRLCGEEGVKGFPTVKLYPRGSQRGSMIYEGERTAGALFKWASLRIPKTVTKLSKVDEITPWVKKATDVGAIEQTTQKHRALLLTKDTKIPLLWKVLGNKYNGQLELSTHGDREGASSVALGMEAGGEKESKVLVYPAGGTGFIRYDGKTKLDALSKYFDSILHGTADVSALQEHPDKLVTKKKKEDKSAETEDRAKDEL